MFGYFVWSAFRGGWRPGFNEKKLSKKLKEPVEFGFIRKVFFLIFYSNKLTNKQTTNIAKPTN